MKIKRKIFLAVLLIGFTVTLSAQRKIELLVERAIAEAESSQRLNGKYLIADFSKLSKLKVIPRDVVLKVTEGKYRVRSIKTVRRIVFNKTHKHVTRFEFRDLALIRQDEIAETQRRKTRDSIRQIQAIAAAKRQDSITKAREAVLVEMNKNKEQHLLGMWLSSVNEIIHLYENGIVEMKQMRGEQQSVRLHWKYDPVNSRLLISSNKNDFGNLGTIYFSAINTVSFYRYDGKKFTMSRTSRAEIERKVRDKKLAGILLNFFGSPQGTMTRDEEYEEFMYWRERGYQ